MNEAAPIVTVGAGHAGVQAAVSVRNEGHDSRIVLISAEPHLPYQRPALSKAFLKRDIPAEALLLRSAAFYAQRSIELLVGDHMAARCILGDTVPIGSKQAVDPLFDFMTLKRSDPAPQKEHRA